MLVENYSSGFLSAGIGTTDTTISITPGNSLPTGTGIFTAILWNSIAYTAPSQDPNAEIVWGQYASANTYTIQRGMEGTVAVAHGIGALVGLYITAGVLSIPYVKVSETQSSGTGSQTSISTNTWVDVVLNNKDVDSASIANLASNQLTLPAGTYKVRARVIIYETQDTQIRLYNNTASSAISLGTSEFAASAGNYTTNCYLEDQFTLTSQSALSIQINASGSGMTGVASSIGTEVYTIAVFEMVNS